MFILNGLLDLLYKTIGAAVGVGTLYIMAKKIKRAKKSKTKRNASNDVPKI